MLTKLLLNICCDVNFWIIGFYNQMWNIKITLPSFVDIIDGFWDMNGKTSAKFMTHFLRNVYGYHWYILFRLLFLLGVLLLEHRQRHWMTWLLYMLFVVLRHCVNDTPYWRVAVFVIADVSLLLFIDYNMLRCVFPFDVNGALRRHHCWQQEWIFCLLWCVTNMLCSCKKALCFSMFIRDIMWLLDAFIIIFYVVHR